MAGNSQLALEPNVNPKRKKFLEVQGQNADFPQSRHRTRASSAFIPTKPMINLSEGITVKSKDDSVKHPEISCEESTKSPVTAEQINLATRIFRQFKRSSGGADGGVRGLNGSIRGSCLARTLNALRVSGREIIDFGAGDGRVLLAAIAAGASLATGYELPENQAHQFVFEAVRETLGSPKTDSTISCHDIPWYNAFWHARDVDKLKLIPESTSCVYTFWVGMPLNTQEHILALCARCPSVDSVAVFRDRKWRIPEDVLDALNARASRRPESAREGAWKWSLHDKFTTHMYGSGERHEIWILHKTL